MSQKFFPADFFKTIPGENENKAKENDEKTAFKLIKKLRTLPVRP